MGRGKRLVIEPPKDYEKVYLPDERFFRIGEALIELGFDVRAYMESDTDNAGRFALDTCLTATKDFDLGDVKAGLEVHTCMSEKLYIMSISYKHKELGIGGNIDVVVEESPNPERFISKVKKTIQNLRDIVEEDIRERRREIQEWREYWSRVDSLLGELGFEKDERGVYIKHVNDRKIVVHTRLYAESRDKLVLYIDPVEFSILADVVRVIESLLAKLPPSGSKVERDG